MIKPLSFEKKVKFFVYIHFTEFFNAGDDAKLLELAAPSCAKLFVHGRAGDDDRLKTSIDEGGGPANAVVLFPSDTAMTVNNYLKYRRCSFKQHDHIQDFDVDAEGVGVEIEKPLQIIVIDSTWRRARKMQHHLKSVIGEVKHVKLETDIISVYARTQSQSGRICSVEAVALMLLEFGESKDICEELIEYVKINNKALTHSFHQKDTSKWKWDPRAYEKGETLMGHPAWYFATRANGLRKPTW
eukprot:CAMPEP_0204857310 /NCGR_PEP_ID=MMETSP1347-20130617/20590_1 /ASSEMBLY_ACC=CAM_ASM_000690 /TAXON_ID=215587 /ORGANISM="Aplanochytrium stocchinoi, Strain GSBS06" /LENGTH=242 /DNA_ID=CAMNT_0052004675 /DNA_START=58 /DNA_END=786 /DNA_ORIENTATION=+